MSCATTTCATSTREFTPREYRTVAVDRTVEALARDVYHAFAWEVTEAPTDHPSPTLTHLALRRNRGVRRRDLVLELETRALADLHVLTHLRRSTRLRATRAALLTGLAGVAFALIAWQTWATGLHVVATIPAVVAITAMAFAPPFHAFVQRADAEAIRPLVEETQERIRESCERAVHLMGPANGHGPHGLVPRSGPPLRGSTGAQETSVDARVERTRTYLSRHFLPASASC